MFKKLVKKVWIICFTQYPYKIRPLERVYSPKTGSPIDMPESLSMILHHETGEKILYHTAPVCLNGEINYRSINGKKRYLPKGIFKEPERYIYNVSGGCILGSLGLVYDPEKRTFIDESAKEWTIKLKHSPYTNLINYPEKEYLKGITLSCLTNGADSGFYHFLLESMIKLYLFQPLLDQADTILLNGPVTDWKLKWLKQANIDLNKIKWITNTSHYECGQLLFTNRLIKDQQISNWCINGLKNLFNVSATTNLSNAPKRVIWLSRKGQSARDIEWEDEILESFPEIELVNLSQFDVEETINIMQIATHIIGPHGAGFSNIYLCSPNVKVLEIYPDNTTFQPCYQRISILCKLQHYTMYLDFNNKQNSTLGFNAFADVFMKFTC